MSVVIEGESFGQRYGRKWIIEGLDFSVPSGTTVLLGPNGAGKTTLIETIVTLRKPASGSLKVLGLDATRSSNIKEIRRQVGFLPQSFGYPKSFTVKQLVEYAAWLKLVPSGKISEAAREALRSVDLLDRADHKISTLSGGMVRRVGIAQAIVHSPRLVVLDEPAVGLDPGQRMRFRKLIRALSETMAFLVSTHIVEDVQVVADTVQVMNEGTIQFTGTTEQLEQLARPDVDGDSPLERGYSAVLTEVGP